MAKTCNACRSTIIEPRTNEVIDIVRPTTIAATPGIIEPVMKDTRTALNFVFVFRCIFIFPNVKQNLDFVSGPRNNYPESIYCTLQFSPLIPITLLFERSIFVRLSYI